MGEGLIEGWILFGVVTVILGLSVDEQTHQEVAGQRRQEISSVPRSELRAEHLSNDSVGVIDG